MDPIEPIGPSPPVTRPFRVTRERREREPDDRRQQPPQTEPPEPVGEEDDASDGHVDVTV
jgi:hypothetical protein